MCVVCVCLLLFCTDHWGVVGGSLCKPVIWNWYPHPRVTMHVGSTYAWRAQKDRTGCIRLIDKTHITATILEMSVFCIQSLMYLNLKFNFHLYIGCYVLFVSYGHVGTNLLIRKHSLQLVVWKCYSTCPDLLIDLST